MKLLKKINNNFALAEDSKGEQVIVEGRGVGFQKMPCELNDLSSISRTYYGFNSETIRLIQTVNPQILQIADQLYNEAVDQIPAELNPNLPFTLADHLEFCIERLNKNIELKMPLTYELESSYPLEMKLAENALERIEEQLGICLPASEKAGIALNIINSELTVKASNTQKEEELIAGCTRIIEAHLHQTIHLNSFNYVRFATHMRYRLRRINEGVSENCSYSLYQTMQKQYAKIAGIVNGMAVYLEVNGYPVSEEEKFYLILHVQRLCDRERCLTTQP